MKIIRNYIEPKLSVLVFGATGLVGKELIEVLLHDERYGNLIIANRREVGYNEEKITEQVINFDELSKIKSFATVDHVFICLGTTIKKAGSKKQFEKIDYHYPLEIAKLSKANNVEVLVHISAFGANASAGNFYLKTKGRAENAIEKQGPKCSFAVQPSMLFGDRDEKRIGESVGKFLMKNLKFLMIGKLKQYRGIEAKDVASAMVEIANKKPVKKRIPSEELKVISKYNSSR